MPTERKKEHIRRRPKGAVRQVKAVAKRTRVRKQKRTRVYAAAWAQPRQGVMAA
jgi:hypothetical protein